MTQTPGARRAGFVLAAVSAAAFGLISFFTLPLMQGGVPAQTALVYRFAIASLMMGAILRIRGERMAVPPASLVKLFFLSSFYLLAVILFFYAFSFVSSGTVATLQYLYPVMVMLIMIGFFHERFYWRIALSVLLAVAGVWLLSSGPDLDPVFEPGYARAPRPDFGSDLFWGLALALISGLFNGLYYVAIQVMKLPGITGLVMTFYVMVFGTFFCLVNALATSSLEWIAGWRDLFLVFMLALVTAVISNLTLIMAIRRVGSTIASIMGVMEPLTAVFVGVVVFGEAFTPELMGGVALIIGAVLLILVAPAGKKAKEQENRRASRNTG